MSRQQRSNKRKMVLDYIRSFIAERSYPPSYSQINKACGLSGSSHASYYVHALRAEGFIDFEDNEVRTIRIIKEDEHGTARATD
jgi:repressor LexA